MNYEEGNNDDLDIQVKTWMLKQFQAKQQGTKDALIDHLVRCPSAHVKVAEGYDGEYGCDTGCSYVRLECTIICEHGNECDFEYGDFGELDWMLEDIAKGAA